MRYIMTIIIIIVSSVIYGEKISLFNNKQLLCYYYIT